MANWQCHKQMVQVNDDQTLRLARRKDRNGSHLEAVDTAMDGEKNLLTFHSLLWENYDKNWHVR